MSNIDSGPLAIELQYEAVSVVPGGSTSIKVTVRNQGARDTTVQLTLQGLPTSWLLLPSPVLHLTAGEERGQPLTIQVPTYPHVRAGGHQLTVRATNQANPSDTAETHCTLTIAALEVPGRIGLLLPATEFSVAPGQSTAIPVILLNRGLERDVFRLSVDRIPSTWVYTATPTITLSPGQQQEVTLNVQVPVGPQASAGRRPIAIRALSQASPGQMAEAPCGLTITSATRFESELRPQSIESGQPARILIENQGNIQQAFAITHHSLENGVTFEPGPRQDVRVPPSEVGVAEFSARPKRRPFFGSERSLPFTSKVEAANQAAQHLNGEVVARPWVPRWFLVAALALVVVLVCGYLALTLIDRIDLEARPTRTPAPEVTFTPDPGIPVEPTQPPPEQPTEAPPEQPTEAPPEQPTEAPPEEPTGAPEELPEGGTPEGG
jgi:hypothetical protein